MSLSTLQRLYENLKPVFTSIEQSTNSPTVGYVLRNNCLYFKNKFSEKIVIPTSLQPQIFHTHHDHPLAGHYGPEHTFKAISNKYYWPTMKKDIESYCTTCTRCQTHKHTNQKVRTPLTPFQITLALLNY